MIYDRDYKVLTHHEQEEYNKYLERKALNKWRIDLKDFMSLPKAIFFYESLFPNNILDIDDLKNQNKTLIKLRKFKELLCNDKIGEREILNYIKSSRSYFIIASLLTKYSFGHHSAYIFPEFELPPNFISDYLIIGKSSHGHEFIFVELEHPNGKITNKEGDLGITVRKGLKQIEDWNYWLESNFHTLKLMFEKYIGSKATLPKEFLSLDKSRIHYALIAGRRKDFTERTYRIVRELKKDKGILIQHYDNLIDSGLTVLQAKNYISDFTMNS